VLCVLESFNAPPSCKDQKISNPLVTDLTILLNYFLGNIWSFRNKDKAATADITGDVTPLVCNNWLQSGCPLNNNMVIHQCVLNHININSHNNLNSTEDNPKQDQVRGLLKLIICQIVWYSVRNSHKLSWHMVFWAITKT
jgi:hypothetical protein